MYSLASMAKAYPWKKAIIYYKLHEEYHDREQELIDFIRKEFEGTDLILRGTRNEYVSDWIDTYELLDDELIWFYCNHDHIYLDNTDYLANYVSMFRKNYSNTLSSIYLIKCIVLYTRSRTILSQINRLFTLSANEVYFNSLTCHTTPSII